MSRLQLMVVYCQQLIVVIYYKYVKLLKLADLAGDKKPAQGGLIEVENETR